MAKTLPLRDNKGGALAYAHEEEKRKEKQTTGAML